MCEESAAPAGVAGVAVTGVIEFAGRNAIPFAVATVVDIAAAFLVSHWVVVVAVTTAAAVLATAGRVAAARLLLRVLGPLVVPVGYDKVNPGAARSTAHRAVRRPVPATVPAIGARASLAIEPPRTLAAAGVIEPAGVLINGQWFPVLSKKEGNVERSQ